MKKVILLFIAITTSFVCIAQPPTNLLDTRKWQSEKLRISFSSSARFDTYTHSVYESTISNNHDSTKEDKRNNRFTDERGILSLFGFTRESRKILCLNIENIHNNPAHYRYAVIGENGKKKYIQTIYWGFRVNFKSKHSSKSYWGQLYFSTSGLNGYSEIQYHMQGDTPRMGVFDNGWKRISYYSTPNVIQIEYQANGMATIYLLDYKGDTSPIFTWEIGNVDKITSIEFLLGPAARLKVSGELYTQNSFARYADTIDKGDAEMKKENYMQAANYYSQAIDKGYKNYDIYMKRANAYFACEFLNNAIDDYTTAIFYEKKAEAFLMRGKAKLLKSDMSGIEDLKKGGPEGIAIVKEIEADKPSMPSSHGGTQYKASGSGFVLSQDGIIVTNYHVVEGMKSIDIFVNQNENTRKYKAKVLISDKTNDISLLKIEDSSFTGFKTLPYSINTKTLDVGTKVFALGYPMSDVLGEEIKLTDGLISSKTGYQGDIVTYQISAPIQPGSSGGPLFDQSGNIVGITNAGIPEAENVGYAIKASYLKNLIDVAPDTIILPTHNYISGLSFTEKVKRLTPYVVLIKVY